MFKPLVNVLSGYCYVSLNLKARSWRLNLAKFRDTAPLKRKKKETEKFAKTVIV